MTLLLVKGDPKGQEELETLEREVNCLESYLEALPSLCVIGYLMRDNPGFLKRLGLFSFYRPYFQTCFTMALFLKSGSCFILPRRGFFGGISTWRFFGWGLTAYCRPDLTFDISNIFFGTKLQIAIVAGECVDKIGRTRNGASGNKRGLTDSYYCPPTDSYY